MKAKITKPDGTTIEIEGDAEDVRAVLREDAEPPAYVPGSAWWGIYPPWYTGTPHPEWTYTTGTMEVPTYTYSVSGPVITDGSRGES